MANRRGAWFERIVGAAGLALGLTAVVLAVAGWRLPLGDGRLGADLFFSAGPTGELEVTPAGPFLRATTMRQGGQARGSLSVRNQTGSLLAVRVRGLPDRPDLDGLLHVEVWSGQTRLFSGLLGRLRKWSPGALSLASGGRATLQFVASLPAGSEAGYQGRIVSVPFELQAKPAR